MMADYNKDRKDQNSEDCVYGCDCGKQNFDDDYFVRIPRKDYLKIVSLLKEALDLISHE